MEKYRVTFIEEEVCHITIEAESEEQAKELFWNGKFYCEDVIRIGGEVSECTWVEKEA
jgi:hypothetical protein